MKERYLQELYKGLINLNDGFDAAPIHYFSEEDFRILLRRAEQLKIGILGIEPWLNGQYYYTVTAEDTNSDPTDPQWYTKAFEDFVATGLELYYAATYFIPDQNNNE